MAKITFLGAGSAVFVRNVIGDCFCSEVLRDCEIALYDIDAGLLNQSIEIISAMQKNAGVSGAHFSAAQFSAPAPFLSHFLCKRTQSYTHLITAGFAHFLHGNTGRARGVADDVERIGIFFDSLEIESRLRRVA